MTIVILPSENIVSSLRYLRNGISQTGKTLTYEIRSQAGTVVNSGSMTESPASSGNYIATWSGHGYTALTRLSLFVFESGKCIAGEDLAVTPIASDTSILTAISDADRWNDGNAI